MQQNYRHPHTRQLFPFRFSALIVILLSTLLVGCTTEQGGQTQSIELEGSNYRGEAVYLGGEQWEYEIIVAKPTPCHQLNSDVRIAESFPQQVFIEVVIEEPERDVVCIQMLEEVTLRGNFAAAEGASVSVSMQS